MKFSTNNNHQIIDYLIVHLICCYFFMAPYSLNASKTSSRCRHDQSSILLQLKQEFPLKQKVDDFEDPKMENWKANKDCCLWDGIICDNTGHVIRLDLSSSSLQGPLLSNSSLFSLVQLQELDLSSNNFSLSEISSGFNHFKSLNALTLNNGNFSGTIPASLGNLSHLTALDLSYNNISGPLPFSLGSLTKMEYLYLDHNQFSGPIPSILGNLSQLIELQLSYNKFDGELDMPLANSTQLQLLALSYNQLTGSIPLDIANSRSLQNLDLSHNFFTERIPPSLFRMPSLSTLNLDYNLLNGSLSIQNVTSSQLEYLYLRRNILSGQLPKSISQLTNLKEIHLFANNLIGRVELGLFSKLSNLSTLDLSHNNLSVTNTGEHPSLPKFSILVLSSCNITEFPMFLKAQNELWQLDLSHNKIQGKIPNWFFTTAVESLNVLDLSSNFIDGWEEQPPTVLPWKSLSFLDLRGNKFQGSPPVPPLSTEHFFMSNNSLSGELHPKFCNLSNLKVLDLSNNQMNGKIPPCLGFINSLLMLKLQKNNFHGGMPHTCKEKGRLKTLDLSHNQLQGNVPQSLIECRELEVLNVGYNNLSDDFPYWSHSLPKLKVLVLRNNKFHGSISPSGILLSFHELRIMDISFNNFEGEIPSEYFGNWSSLNSEIPYVNKSKLRYMGDVDNYYQDSMTLAIKGADRSYTKILTTLSAIDISHNHFRGWIPSSVGDLKSLMVLNLSHNSFQGLIPSSLGKLSELESLDLSRNNLVGEIPQELTKLTFLSYLDLSDNQLSGRIPQGGQFNTFQNSSFAGNLDLCDSPLSKKCGCSNTTPNCHPIPKPKSEPNISFGWKQVATGYGCGLVIGVLIELVVSSRRPSLFARFY